MDHDLVIAYEEYLQRFDSQIGEVEIGGFSKHNGQLVKKLAYEEFEPLYREYSEMRDAYIESLKRGDTINDLVVKLVREFATKLILSSPA